MADLFDNPMICLVSPLTKKILGTAYKVNGNLL